MLVCIYLVKVDKQNKYFNTCFCILVVMKHIFKADIIA